MHAIGKIVFGKLDLRVRIFQIVVEYIDNVSIPLVAPTSVGEGSFFQAD